MSAVEPGIDEPLPRARHAGAVLWPSFFAAGVATTVCFAFVDPLELRDLTFPSLPLTRGVGYTIGFFLFWSATFAASAFTALLLLPPRGAAIRP